MCATCISVASNCDLSLCECLVAAFLACAYIVGLQDRLCCYNAVVILTRIMPSASHVAGCMHYLHELFPIANLFRCVLRCNLSRVCLVEAFRVFTWFGAFWVCRAGQVGAFLVSQESCVPGWGVGIDRVVVLTRAMSSASYVVGAAYHFMFWDSLG